MFDYLTEENDFGRGESDSGDGENGSTHNIHKFRQKMEVLNQDLHHDQIFDGEDGEDADLGEDQDSPEVLNTKKKMTVKKSGKPQNLDLLPSNYIYQSDEALLTPVPKDIAIHTQQPSHMVKEVVHVDDGYTLIQESIFNKDYSEEEAESDMSENDDGNAPELDEFP